MYRNEPDRLQCSAQTDQKMRCTRIGTHSNGSKVLCEKHHQMYLIKRANDSLIERKKK